MLKNLARWMRVFGARVVFAGDLKKDAEAGAFGTGAESARGQGKKSLVDDELLRFAFRNKMVFLTRDEELGKKAQNYVPTVLFRTMDLDAQLVQVFRRFNLRVSKIPSRALCAHCGGKLKRVPKASVREKVFPKVYAHNRVFWQCQNPNCRQLYWKGSHWQKILKKAEKISRMLSATLKSRRAAGAQGLKLRHPA